VPRNGARRERGTHSERAIRYADREYGAFDEIELEPNRQLSRMDSVDYLSERDASLEITPEVLNAGIQAFRAGRIAGDYLTHPDESYPFYDCALERGLEVVFRAMLERARSAA